MWNVPTLDMVATGERLKAFFKERHISVEFLRQSLKLESTQAIYKWFRGVSLPSIDNLYAMSVIFNFPINEMLVGRGELQREREEAQEPLPFFMPFFVLHLNSYVLNHRFISESENLC